MSSVARRRIAAVVLAAGRSRRMGANKLLLELDGKPLVRHVLDAIAASHATTTIVILGHEAAKVRAALADCAATFVVNEAYHEGLASSLHKGVAALPAEVDGAMIFLSDMPDIEPALIDRMIAAFDPDRHKSIVVPIRHGRRGHPVLWGGAFFPLLLTETQGDAGAKALIDRFADQVVEIAAPTDGVLRDLDTPEDFFRRAQTGRPA